MLTCCRNPNIIMVLSDVMMVIACALKDIKKNSLAPLSTQIRHTTLYLNKQNLKTFGMFNYFSSVVSCSCCYQSTLFHNRFQSNIMLLKISLIITHMARMATLGVAMVTPHNTMHRITHSYDDFEASGTRFTVPFTALLLQYILTLQ